MMSCRAPPASMMIGWLYPARCWTRARARSPCPSVCRGRRAWRRARRPTRQISRSPSTSGALANAPGRNGRIEIRDVVLLPEHAPRLCIEREQVARSRRARRRDHRLTVGVARGPIAYTSCSRCSRRPFVRPEHGAGALVERENPLDRRGWPRRARIGDKHTAAGDGRAGVAGVDGGAPHRGQSAGRKRVDDAGLVPDAEPARAPPLWPVVGNEANGGGQQTPAPDATSLTRRRSPRSRNRRLVMASCTVGIYRLFVGASALGYPRQPDGPGVAD